MSKYEFSLRQEVLLEKGADILAEFFHYAKEKNIPLDDKQNPVNVISDLVWDAKSNILAATTEIELDKIEAEFDFARRFYRGIVA